MVGPPIFIWLYGLWGWRAAFVFTASTGFIWVVLWLLLYRKPPDKVDIDEKPVPPISWSQALRYRQTWGFAAGKFLTDPVWWFYLYWLPPYLYDVRKFNLKEIGWALPVVYLAADFGSVAGGWVSGALIRRGWDVARARQTTMAVCAFCMPISALCGFVDSPVLTIALVSLATASHQGWSANLYTTTSDVFPKFAVASVTGIGGFAGGVGGYLFGENPGDRGNHPRLQADVRNHGQPAPDGAVSGESVAVEQKRRQARELRNISLNSLASLSSLAPLASFMNRLMKFVSNLPA